MPVILPAMAALAAYNAYQSHKRGKDAAANAKRQERTLDAALGEYDKLGALNLPELRQELIKNPESYEQLLKEVRFKGYDPAQMQVEKMVGPQDLGPSALSSISLDPATRNKQIQAMAALQEIADKGGMTLADEANLNKTLGAANTRNRGTQEAIIQSMAARGGLNSGLEAMMRAQGAQADIEGSSMAGQQAAANAQQRALQAILSGGDMAARMEGADYNRQSAAAQANDLIKQFNSRNQMATAQANMQAGNAAASQNANLVQQAAADRSRGQFDADRLNAGNYNTALGNRYSQKWGNDIRNTDIINAQNRYNQGDRLLNMRNDANNLAVNRVRARGLQADMFGKREERNAIQSAAHADKAAQGLMSTIKGWDMGGGSPNTGTQIANGADFDPNDPRFRNLG